MALQCAQTMLLRDEGRPASDLDQLRREVELLRALLEGSSDMVDLLDEQGRLQVEFQGRNKALGYARRELMGQNVLALVHPDDADEVQAALAQLVARSAEDWQGQARFRHKGGHYLTLEIVARSMLDDPDVRGIVVYGVDVTDKLELQQKLQQSERMESVGRLASGIAHDFNNLLSVISMSVALGRRKSSHMNAAMDDIHAAAERGRNLIKRLFSLGRHRSARPRRLELAETLEGVTRGVRTVLSDNIELRLQLPEAPCHVLMDPAQLEQVLLNLGLNARDAMPEGGALEIELRREGALACIEVRDTGVGMDPETQARAFEPFFTTKDHSHGTGLGLASVRDAVLAAGGSVELASQVGKGTSFVLRFPTADS
jgi:PAS domain S-box-containing protein